MSRRAIFGGIAMLLLLLLCDRASVRALEFQPRSILMTNYTADVMLVNADAATSWTCGLHLLNEASNSSSPSCDYNASENWTVTYDPQNSPVVPLTLTRIPTDPKVVVEEALAVRCCQSDKTATLLVQVSIRPLEARIDGNISLVTGLPNPAYVPLSMCPCDLTQKACDVGCCCDHTCTMGNGGLLSSCLPGVFGGLVSPPFEHLCSEQQARNAPDWFPFLCVQSPAANSPMLGLFHTDSPVLMTLDALKTKLDQIPVSPSFAKERTGQTNAPCLSSNGNMKQGSPTCVQNRLLTLPQATLAGHCLQKAPVSFLKDVTSRCVLRPPLQLLCTNNSSLSIDAYSKDVDTKTCSLSVLGASMQLSPTNVSFIPEGIIQSTQQRACLQVRKSNETCIDAVVAVTYEVTWKNFSVRHIHAKITLANVSLANDASLVQEFSVQFINPVNGSQIITPRSGNPGYLVGKPLLTAVSNNNGSVNLTEGLHIWYPVGSSLCAEAQTTQVKFGENSISGCLLRLGLTELNNCTNIRHNILQGWNRLLSANLVGRRGNSNPNPNDTHTDWVTIDNKIPKIENLTKSTGRPGMCAEVPARLHIRVLTAMVGNVEREPQMEIVAVNVSVSNVTWQLSCIGAEGAACVNTSFVQSFQVTSSVQFIRVATTLTSSQTRFQLNYTEFDCSRNDVCWPELALPFITTYKGRHDPVPCVNLFSFRFEMPTAAIFTPGWCISIRIQCVKHMLACVRAHTHTHLVRS
ncbi:tectonic-2 isoform X2 [Lethenteron reissneri]|uniref:tectonic-2 isoform X2 n=1 Tax=Lethenteron reissneri TaxID=7753 RepID=UPI002AB74B94|nr:tectonic-2 isoform X2 [Lethenteron reissneri]